MAGTLMRINFPTRQGLRLQQQLMRARSGLTVRIQWFHFGIDQVPEIKFPLPLAACKLRTDTPFATCQFG